ncbi:MAG: zinc ABC transporter substrate-binding protein [Desulforhopalus sp.]|nr:zinc ABC transporter substrate-binding protein [Desulforhopalus sp.]
MRHLTYTIFFLLFALLSSQPQAAARPEEMVFVSILPQKFFMQQICKDSLNIEVMVAPGANPHTYEPKPSQMRKLAASRAYFAIGMPFEATWLDKFTGVNPKLKIVHTNAGIDKLAMVEHHDNGHGDEGSDPHIWLSPTLVKKQAETMTDALSGLFPDKASFFRENLAAFTKEIDILDGELRSTLKGKEGLRFMVFHPSWGYFARDYGLEQVAVEIEGKEPKPAQLHALIKEARAQNIHVIFAQPQFSSKSAKLLAREIAGEVVLIDPLSENWFDNMRQVAGKLRIAAK